MKQTIGKRWTFTVNNWEPKDEQLFQELECKYLVYGREVGESGTPHLQGFVTFKSNKALTGLKKIHGTAHWEQALGTSEQNRVYCTKDGDYFEKGDVPSQGQRTDLKAVCEMVKAGESLQSIASEHPDTWVKFGRGLTSLKLILETPYEHDGVRGIWLHGPPKVGKSHHARQFAMAVGGLYNKAQNKWWDGYNGEPAVILDDMDNDALHHYLKIWGDKWACTGETKGGTVHLKHKWFIVTSNETIEELFALKPAVMRDAIRRRFKEIAVTKRVEEIKALTALVEE